MAIHVESFDFWCNLTQIDMINHFENISLWINLIKLQYLPYTWYIFDTLPMPSIHVIANSKSKSTFSLYRAWIFHIRCNETTNIHGIFFIPYPCLAFMWLQTVNVKVLSHCTLHKYIIFGTAKQWYMAVSWISLNYAWFASSYTYDDHVYWQLL